MKQRKAVTPKQRREMFEKHGRKCFYCGLELPEDCLDADHLIPDGGMPLVPACSGCNRSKGERCPIELVTYDPGYEGAGIAAWFFPWAEQRRARLGL